MGFYKNDLSNKPTSFDWSMEYLWATCWLLLAGNISQRICSRIESRFALVFLFLSNRNLSDIFCFELFFVDGRNLGSASQLDRVKSMSRDELESDLTFVALLLFRNELKPDTRSAIEDLRAGEVRILYLISYSMLPKFWPAPFTWTFEALGWFQSNFRHSLTYFLSSYVKCQDTGNTPFDQTWTSPYGQRLQGQTTSSNYLLTVS